MTDDDQTKPVNAGDDFSANDDTVNPADAELDAGVGDDALNGDTDEETLDTDFPQDNPLSTESGVDEVDNKILPEDQKNLGDVVVYDPLEDDEDDEE